MAFFHDGETAFRPLARQDLDAVRCLRSDFSTWRHLTAIGDLTEERQLAWWNALASDPSRKYFIASIPTSDYVGMVRMTEIDLLHRSACVGCDVFPEHRNRGFGQKIMRWVVHYGFDWLNLHRLWLLVSEENMAAKHVYEKCGFTEEGRQRQALFKKGRYVDYIMMSILEPEYRI